MRFRTSIRSYYLRRVLRSFMLYRINISTNSGRNQIRGFRLIFYRNLQEFVFVALDIYREKHQNKNIEKRLDGWLTFLISDEPEDIIALIERYPDFKAMYEQIYEICCNIEQVMGNSREIIPQLRFICSISFIKRSFCLFKYSISSFCF